MKIYSYVKFDWDEKTQRYVEVYSESVNYEGEVAECKGGGGGGGGGPIRYAPYLEEKHKSFLDLYPDLRDEAIDDNPYDDYVSLDVDPAFLGAQLISDFPALYDLYGTHMTGIVVEDIWEQSFEDTVNAPSVHDLIVAEGALLDDDIETNSLPRFQAGMRDLNSVMSSTYVIGKALIEEGKVKAMAKFASGVRTQLIPTTLEKMRSHLDWHKTIVMNYAEIIKLYYSAKMDTVDANLTTQSKDALWPFTVLEFERAAIGALEGAAASGGVAGASTAQKAIGGAMSGAAAGAMVGGPPGAAIGGLIGMASGLF